MIAFVSLFLGLVAGPQFVEVAVSEEVELVELWLDGEEAARLGGPPWRTEVDFGDALRTHELTAVARDGSGAELGRTVQQINVPRPAAETRILLGGWQGGRPRHARLIWTSRRLAEPESIAVSLDGEALAVVDPARIELPPVDPSSIHFLSAELTFPGNQRSTAQAIFGGRYGEEVATELTAVPVRLGRERLERAEEAGGWLRRTGGGALEVVAVEDDPAQVFVVRDEAAVRALRRLERGLLAERRLAYQRLGLVREDRLFLMSARAEVTSHQGVDYELYPISRAFGLDDASLPRALARFSVGDGASGRQRLSDAVAVAGVRAAAGGRRRAVLLVVERCQRPSGRWTGAQVRRYLAELRVPLEVWTTDRYDRKAGGFCRDGRQIVNSESYGGAISSLRRRLRRQQILWVEGRHLPREIVLAESAPAREVVELN